MEMDTKQLKKAYDDAIELGFSQTAIAEHSGVPVASLRKFRQGEAMGEHYKKMLWDWLTKSGSARSPLAADPALVIAKELRNLADVLESGIDIELKRLRLSSLLDAYGNGRALGTTEEIPKRR